MPSLIGVSLSLEMLEPYASGRTYVGTILGATPLNIQFRRALIGDKGNAMLHLVRRLMEVTLTNEPDTFQWRLTSLVCILLNLCIWIRLILDLFLDKSTFGKPKCHGRSNFSCGLCVGVLFLLRIIWLSTDSKGTNNVVSVIMRNNSSFVSR